MTKTFHVVDSREYAISNCFQHQLTKSLADTKKVELLPLSQLEQLTQASAVICCLKQRTLYREVDRIAKIIGDTPVVIYDQDPWQAYMDDSPYRGTYELVCNKLNVRSIAVTTQRWTNFLKDRGLPATFVRMWILPEYCNEGLTYEERPVTAGFIGTVHPYRRDLFIRLKELGSPINVQSGNVLGYTDYLKALQEVRIFVHSEDGPLVVNGNSMNLKDGLWIKDVEAASQGCFTIRNRGADPESYYEGLETTRLYDSPEEIPRLLSDIQNMDVSERQATIHRTVEYIRVSNKWQETAAALISLSI